MRIIELRQVDSTNSYVQRNAAGMAHGDVVVAHEQTAGRGQRGNGWEGEPGANLTFTIFLEPDLPAASQFSLSCMVALDICDVLEEMCGVPCRVKWPNDIYAGGDRKICGVLISHSLQGAAIRHTIAGIGININQTVFLSDAPNPVSVRQLTGRPHDCDAILRRLAARILDHTPLLSAEEYRLGVAARYRMMMWRGDGEMYPFRDTSDGEIFRAAVKDIEPTGHLHLLDARGSIRRYAFKEVEWL